MIEERLTPQAPEVETAVIGAILLGGDAFDKVCEIIDSDAFYITRNATIFEAAKELNNLSSKVDLMTVASLLAKREGKEIASVFVELGGYQKGIMSSASIESHARIIKQKHIERKAIEIAHKMLNGVYGAEDVQDVLDNAEQSLFEIEQGRIQKDYRSLGSAFIDAFQEIQAAASCTDGISGIASGFNELDAITSGWQNSDLIILAARPGMGKTAFALSMAINMAIKNRTPVGFFSLEMGDIQLAKRIASNIASIDGTRIKNGQMDYQEYSRLDSSVNTIEDAPLYLDETPALSLFALRAKARRMVKKQGVKIIMIDYMQLMTAKGGKINNRQEEVSTISRGLKALAKELNIPIIALSQLNRESVSREGAEPREPRLNDLRESGAIEQDADIVAFVHRPSYYGKTETDTGIDISNEAKIIVAKHRNGATGDIKLNFKGKYTRFENVESFIPHPIKDDAPF